MKESLFHSSQSQFEGRAATTQNIWAAAANRNWGCKGVHWVFSTQSFPFHSLLQNYSHSHRDLPHLKAQQAIKLIFECGGNQGLFTANFRAELNSEVHNKIHSTPPTTQIKHSLQMHWRPRTDPTAAAPHASALLPPTPFISLLLEENLIDLKYVDPTLLQASSPQDFLSACGTLAEFWRCYLPAPLSGCCPGAHPVPVGCARVADVICQWNTLCQPLLLLADVQ